MPMPKWHEIMRPVLEMLATVDGFLGSTELIDGVASTFALTEEERAERLKSGQSRLYNRTYWAITDLEKAGYLAYGEKRGTYRITEEGRRFLEAHAGPITAGTLYESSASFKAWKDGYQKRGRENVEATTPDDADGTSSPLEIMEHAHEQLREALIDELLQTIMAKDPYAFEALVVRLLLAMGYGADDERSGIVTKKSSDGGIDGIIRQDRLGFDRVYVQAKRWDTNRRVSAPDIQQFVGALSVNKATKGLFITTAAFTEGARSCADDQAVASIALVDGRELASLMIEYGVGASTRSTFEVKTIDSDFFDEL